MPAEQSWSYITDPKTPEEVLLKRLRDRFEYAQEQWKDIRAEGKKDMDYLSGNPWTGDEKTERKNEGRPAMVWDELNQYVNQVVNDFRMNPHTVKVDSRSPELEGRAAAQARVRADIIRAVEYRSNGKAAYVTGHENQVQRSEGYWRVSRRYVDEDSFEQELCLKPLPSVDNVLFDPDFKEKDASDIRYAFVLERVPKAEYSSRWPNAQVQDFSSELAGLVPKWISARDVQVAEYWEVTEEPYELVLVANRKGAKAKISREDFRAAMRAAEQQGKRPAIRELASKRAKRRKVTQYMTNGVEVLEKTEWDGRWIPLIGAFGKEMWVDRGAGPVRTLLSLVRLARDPYMFYCYLRTSEAEEAAMTPKTPFIGAKGQFNKWWALAAKQPVAYLEYSAVTDATGSNVLGPPQRQPFEPHFAAYEVAAEAARRAIQAAMGISPLPTAAQRRSEKSGVALDKIDAQEQKGSFHLLDNLLMSIEHCGRVMNDLMDKTYDTGRNVSAMKEDGTSYTAMLNQDHEDAVDITGDPHDVTVTTGPSFADQRAAAEDFAETIAKVPGVFPLIGDLLVRLRNLGPIGDQIAERLTPAGLKGPDGKPLPPAAAALVGQLQQQLQALNAYAKQVEEEKQQLELEKKAKVIDNEYKLKLAKLEHETQIAVAEITTKAQDLLARLETTLKAWQDMHGDAAAHAEASAGRAHELEVQRREQEHEAAQADEQRAHEQEQQEAAQDSEGAQGASGAEEEQ